MDMLRSVVIGTAVGLMAATGSAAAQDATSDPGMRLAQYEARAAAGDAVAAEQAGLIHYHGVRPHGRNLQRAVVYLQQAAAEGRPGARLLLDHLTEEARAADPKAYVPWPWGC